MSQTVAQDQMESCQGMVRSIALAVQRKLNFAHELDDLIAYGQVGLAQAVKEFDPERGAQLSTYAYYRIRGAIYDGVSKMGWQRFTQRRDAAWNDVLAEDAERSEEHTGSANAEWFEGVARQLATATLLLSSAEDSGRQIADDSVPQPLSQLCSDELKLHLHNLLKQLPEESAGLMRAIYFDGQTMQDAATNLGISKSWASRSHAKALQTLGDRLRRMGLAD